MAALDYKINLKIIEFTLRSRKDPRTRQSIVDKPQQNECCNKFTLHETCSIVSIMRFCLGKYRPDHFTFRAVFLRGGVSQVCVGIGDQRSPGPHLQCCSPDLDRMDTFSIIVVDPLGSRG